MSLPSIMWKKFRFCIFYFVRPGTRWKRHINYSGSDPKPIEVNRSFGTQFSRVPISICFLDNVFLMSSSHHQLHSLWIQHIRVSQISFNFSVTPLVYQWFSWSHAWKLKGLIKQGAEQLQISVGPTGAEGSQHLVRIWALSSSFLAWTLVELYWFRPTEELVRFLLSE